MPIQNLSKIFEARSVAVIGTDLENDAARGGVGRTVLENLKSAHFPGPIHRVNPERDPENCAAGCVSAVANLPMVPDLAVICTVAEMVPRMVRECGERGVLGVLILSTGFRELGTAEGRDLESVVRREARAFPGMKIIGPNSAGVITPGASLNASQADGGMMPKRGSVAFISQSGRRQSGRLCTAILDWADMENVGFSHFVSVGNMMDVTIADLIDYFSSDRWTQSLILYVESITDAREFMSAARAFSRKKPIIAFKAGRCGGPACAFSSHSGAMATADLVYRAALDRAGVVRVVEMEDMFDCAELLAKKRTPSGPRLAVITNAGGPGVVAVDSLLSRKGVLAQLSERTNGSLSELLPTAAILDNPVDITGDATPQMLSAALETIISDGGIDAVIIIFAPQAGNSPTDAAQAVIGVAKKTQKPVLTTWMGGRKVEDGIKLFNDAGIPTYKTPERAVRAFMYLVSYSRTREVLYETPRDIPVEFSVDRAKIRSVFECLAGHAPSNVLSEKDSKMLLDAYGIPTSEPIIARSAEDAVWHAQHIGYPVAMKVSSPQITHKTCVDGVALNLANDNVVTSTFSRVVQNAREKRPGADIIGVTVQRMVSDPLGVQLLLGAKHDPIFGTVVLAGMGGVGAELYNDVVLELPPLNERLARRMLESLRLWPLLNGYAGRPAVNVNKLIEILIRLSYLVADFPEIRELDVNPLLVTPSEVVALDAHIIIYPKSSEDAVPMPYSHLAIRPYPEEFVRAVTLRDGTRVLLRPIKPEDEPMWHEMLAGCSQETILFRFFYLFKNTTHEMATRYCYIDYDREMAIVAEIREACGRRRLIGVGRLVSDADHVDAEYAVVVQDEFQGKGLGALLTDYCIEICQRWGIETVVAETSPGNRRMLGLFGHRGFELIRMDSDDIVLAKKHLG